MIYFCFLIIIGIFYSLKILGNELNKQSCNANLMSGTLLNHFLVGIFLSFEFRDFNSYLVPQKANKRK